MAVGLLAGSTVAHAVTTETRVVSEFSHWDDTGPWVEGDTGWENHSTTGARAEIGSAHGAPKGLGREAVMLDNPRYGDIAQITARVGQQDQTPLKDAFPGVLADSDLHLGFWVYLPAESLSSSLEVRTSLVMADESWWYLEFHLEDNGYDQRGTWTYVDTTADGATWTVIRPGVLGAPQMTWSQVVTAASEVNGNPPSLGNVSFTHWHGDFSAAIDGVTVRTATWETVSNFELATTSSRPLLDDCKNDGWRTNYPAGAYKNQGACIAAIVAT